MMSLAELTPDQVKELIASFSTLFIGLATAGTTILTLFKMRADYRKTVIEGNTEVKKTDKQLEDANIENARKINEMASSLLKETQDQIAIVRENNKELRTVLEDKDILIEQLKEKIYELKEENFKLTKALEKAKDENNFLKEELNKICPPTKKEGE